MTYNHSSYIREAMDGFCSQQTNFPFVCVIMDDASSDGEQDILNNYLQENFDLDDESISYTEETDNYNLIFTRHKINYNCHFAVLFLKENHYKKKSKNQYLKKEWISTKYLAVCEGDDYWTDPLKLQKQVDFLEANPEIVYTCHYYDILKDKEIIPSKLPKYINKEGWTIFNLEQAFSDIWITKTLTSVFRSNIYLKVDISKFKAPRDIHIIYSLLKHGNGAYLSDNCGTYRKHDGGVWSKLTDSEKFINNLVFWDDVNKFSPTKLSKNKCQEFYYLYYMSRLMGNKIQLPPNVYFKQKYFYLFPLLYLKRKIKKLIKKT